MQKVNNSAIDEQKQIKTPRVCKLDRLVYSFIALCLFVAPMFFANDQSDYLFIWIAFILCLVPIAIVVKHEKGKAAGEIFIAHGSARVIKLLNSPLCMLLFFYAMYISLRTCAVEGFNFATIQENILLQLVPLLIYLAVLNRLSFDFKNFTLWFSGCITIFAALSALLSIMFYSTHINNLNDILVTRLEIIPIGVATGTLTTHYSLTFALYAMSAMLIFLESKSPPIKIFFLYLFMIIFAALLLTQSRGALLAFIVTLFGYFLTSWVSFSVLRACLASLFGSVITTLTIFVLWQNGRLGDFGFRLEVWNQAMALATGNLLFGYGERDFFLPMEAYPNNLLYHGHNVLINALLRGGIIGFVTMLAFIVIALYQSFILMRKFHDSLPFCWLLIFSVSGMFDYDVVVRNKGWEWIVFWTVLGMAAAAGGKLTYYESQRDNYNQN